MTRAGRFEKAPDIPILPILEYLTGAPADLLGSTPWGRKMRCPFHTDNHPSAAINHQGTAFKCMSCDRAGDAIKLLREEEGLDFPDALRIAQELTGVESGTVSPRSARPGRDPLEGLLVG